MGRDFICCYIPAARLDEARMRTLLELAASEKPSDWEDSYETADECRAAVAAAVEYLTELPNRETAIMTVADAQYPVLLTGGMSGGDTPTDCFDQFEAIILHAPAVLEQLERWAKEDQEQGLGHGGGGATGSEREEE
jgi:hypothetical protein